MSEREDDLEFLLRLGALADQLTLRSWRSTDLPTRTKPDGTPVTSVDVEVEHALRDHVLERHPDDSVVSEELGLARGTSGRCWYIDGVDGTTAYADGRAEWSTFIALTDPGGLIQGLCTAPALGKRWFVDADGRAVVSDAGEKSGPVRVSTASPTSPVRVACWPPARRIGQHLGDEGRNWLEEMTVGRSTRPSWGAGVPNAAMLVAEGALDGFVLVGGGPSDHAAAAAIVEAAGGAWSGLSGRRDLDASVVVFSNGTIHDWLVAQLGDRG